MGGYYEDGTLIWRDRWVTSSGVIVESREALCFPGHPHKAVVLRTVRAVRGTARMRSTLSPKANYGETAFRSWRQAEDGSWTARADNLRVRWSGGPTSVAQRGGGAELTTEFVLAEGDEQHLVLELSEGPFDAAAPVPSMPWSATEAAW